VEKLILNQNMADVLLIVSGKAIISGSGFILIAMKIFAVPSILI
jgi:hypothetical protein